MIGTTDVQAARDRLKARFGHSVRVGGETGVRLRRRTTAVKNNAADERKVQTAIKKLGLSQFPSVDEVIMSKKDGTALHFTKPQVKAIVNANTFVIIGPAEKQTDNVMSLPFQINQNLWKSFMPDEVKSKTDSVSVLNAIDDDEIPELVENFEDISKLDEPETKVEQAEDSSKQENTPENPSSQ